MEDDDKPEPEATEQATDLAAPSPYIRRARRFEIPRLEEPEPNLSERVARAAIDWGRGGDSTITTIRQMGEANANGDAFTPEFLAGLGVDTDIRNSVLTLYSGSSVALDAFSIHSPYLTGYASLRGSFMAGVLCEYDDSSNPWYPRHHTPGNVWGTETMPAAREHATHFHGEQPGQRWLRPCQGSWWDSYAASGDMWTYQTITPRCCYVLELLLSLETLLKNPGVPLHHTMTGPVWRVEECQFLLVHEAERALSALEEGDLFCSPLIFPGKGRPNIATPLSPLVSDCLRPYWNRLHKVMGGKTQLLMRSVGTDPPAVFFGAETIIQLPLLENMTKPLRRAFTDAFPQKYWNDDSLASWEPENISQLVEKLREIIYRPKGITPPEVLVIASWIIARGWEAEYKELFGAVWELLPLHGCVKQLSETERR